MKYKINNFFIVTLLLTITSCVKPKNVVLTVVARKLQNEFLYIQEKDGFNLVKIDESINIFDTFEFEYKHIVTEEDIAKINKQTTYDLNHSGYARRSEKNYISCENVKYYDDYFGPGYVLTENLTIYYFNEI